MFFQKGVFLISFLLKWVCTIHFFSYVFICKCFRTFLRGSLSKSQRAVLGFLARAGPSMSELSLLGWILDFISFPPKTWSPVIALWSVSLLYQSVPPSNEGWARAGEFWSFVWAEISDDSFLLALLLPLSVAIIRYHRMKGSWLKTLPKE